MILSTANPETDEVPLPVSLTASLATVSGVQVMT